MHGSLTLVCGVTIALLSAFVGVRYLNAPLRRQLQQLCGNNERADFGAAFSPVTVVLTPPIFALSVESSSEDLAELAVSKQWRWGFVGPLVSVLMLARILGRFIPRTPLPQPDFPDRQKASAQS